MRAHAVVGQVGWGGGTERSFHIAYLAASVATAVAAAVVPELVLQGRGVVGNSWVGVPPAGSKGKRVNNGSKSKKSCDISICHSMDSVMRWAWCLAADSPCNVPRPILPKQRVGLVLHNRPERHTEARGPGNGRRIESQLDPPILCACLLGHLQRSS